MEFFTDEILKISKLVCEAERSKYYGINEENRVFAGRLYWS